MSDSITVRNATPQDWEFLRDGNLALASETEDKTLPSDTVGEGVKALLADPNKGQYLIAELDGQPAAQTMITREWSDWRNGWFWWIQSVYVHRDFRRRGLYRAIWDHVCQRAKAAGDVCGIRLYVERENAPAIATYEAMDMKDSGYFLFEKTWQDTAS